MVYFGKDSRIGVRWLSSVVTRKPFFSYNCGMVVDDLSLLSQYHPLDESLRSLQDLPCEGLPVFHGFMVDRRRSTLFTVERGAIMASTSWRESPESMEATAAVHVGPGSFVLYLPGEPYLVKAETEDTEATMRRAGV